MAGQTHNTSAEFSAHALSWRATRQQGGVPAPVPMAPEWMERLQAFDPRRVVFAHDHAVWEP